MNNLRSDLSNPDFMSRIEKNAPLNEVDYITLYTPGAQEYIDYPVLEELAQLVQFAIRPDTF